MKIYLYICPVKPSFYKVDLLLTFRQDTNHEF